MRAEVKIVGDSVLFIVGNQSFRLAYEPDDPESLEWMAKQLRNALDNAEPEAIALLRRYHETLDTIHSFMHEGFDEKCFSCVLLQDGEKYLEGGDES